MTIILNPTDKTIPMLDQYVNLSCHITYVMGTMVRMMILMGDDYDSQAAEGVTIEIHIDVPATLNPGRLECVRAFMLGVRYTLCVYVHGATA